VRFLVFSTYQVYGAYAHLFQQDNRDVLDLIAQASGLQVPKVWDPLCPVVPYNYVMPRLCEPPDCQLWKSLTIALIIGVYMIPLLQGMAYLVFLQVRQCVGLPSPTPVKSEHCTRHHCTALATAEPTLQGSTAISFDTDGIPLIVDNSVTCIITNNWSLFPGNLVLVQLHVDTIDTSKSRQQYQETVCLELVNNINTKHIYNIPNAIYNPASNLTSSESRS
jgi:hypothetical protein